MTQPPNSDTIVSPLTRLYRQRTSDLLAYRRKTRKQVLHQLKGTRFLIFRNKAICKEQVFRRESTLHARTRKEEDSSGKKRKAREKKKENHFMLWISESFVVFFLSLGFSWTTACVRYGLDCCVGSDSGCVLVSPGDKNSQVN